MRRILYMVVELVLVVVWLAYYAFEDRSGSPEADQWNSVLNFYDLLAWDLIAVTLVVARWIQIRSGRAQDETTAKPDLAAPDWLRETWSRRIGFFTTVAVSLIGLYYGLQLAGLSDELAYDARLALLAVVAVLAAWMLLQFGYADRYAYLHYRVAPSVGLRFPETERPNPLDFTYFAFTMGTTFAVSDVAIQHRTLRYTVVQHGVLSFFYNAGIVAVAIGALTGK